ncbi:hypothetical protein [Nonomuraea soli]|uniref:Uncharacterized protein n=1 Tax=Nonomuraea soli TaxID=1032476 RepID=A0A7W0HUD2_9ACTN|nr:hypothetical protein [Nonomuraea soli]MBA2896034.1 hypothetical protein [Nonomuraea soli]
MNSFRPARSRSVEEVDLDSLLALVADSLGHSCTFAADGARLTLGPQPSRDGHQANGKHLTVHLTGLRREAGRRPREDWPMLVSEHLKRALADASLPDPCDLDQVRPLLRTRVEAVEEVPDLTRVVGRHLGPDLVELLTVHDRPVRPEEAGCWPIPSAQALEVALANVRQADRPALTPSDLGGTPVWHLHGTVAAASHLHWLDDHLPVPADGVLVIMPGADSLVVHPVDGIGVVRAIERLRVHALRAGGPSEQVYWWHAGRLTLIRADIVMQEGQTRLVVAPPPEFARVLARLAQQH